MACLAAISRALVVVDLAIVSFIATGGASATLCELVCFTWLLQECAIAGCLLAQLESGLLPLAIASLADAVHCPACAQLDRASSLRTGYAPRLYKLASATADVLADVRLIGLVRDSGSSDRLLCERGAARGLAGC